MSPKEEKRKENHQYHQAGSKHFPIFPAANFLGTNVQPLHHQRNQFKIVNFQPFRWEPPIYLPHPFALFFRNT